MFDTIDRKRDMLDAKRPLPVHTLTSIREHLIVEWTYHSNAIEGNTLTLSETKVALEGITVGGKTIREHLEAINHKDAIVYVEENVQRKERLTEWQIKNIHRLILKGIEDEYAGLYRKENVIISGAQHLPPDAIHVQAEMERFIEANMIRRLIPRIQRATGSRSCRSLSARSIRHWIGICGCSKERNPHSFKHLLRLSGCLNE